MRKLLFPLFLAVLLQGCEQPEPKTAEPAPSPPLEAIEPAPAPLTMMEEASWRPILEDVHLEGSILVLDAQTNTFHGTNLARTSLGFLPASTFKIPNTIVAIETGVVKDFEQMIKWDGQERRMSSWEEDMNIRMAYKRSCLPCYQQLAREVGLERMQKTVQKLGYPGMDIRQETLDSFWILGESRITQVEQIEFLQRLHNQELSIAARTYSMMKTIMEHESTDDYTMYAKTGWAVFGENDEQHLGWFVGYVTQGEKVWYFATNVEPGEGLNMDDFGRLRIQVTKEALLKIGAITETIG